MSHSSSPTQRTASSFGPTNSNQNSNNTQNNATDQPLNPSSRNYLTSDAGPLSVASINSPRHVRNIRGDIQPTAALQHYLASELSSQVNGTQTRNDLSSAPDNSNPPPVIWGTTVNIQDSMALFRSFILNYVDPLDQSMNIDDTPFYLNLLTYLHQNQIYNLNLDCSKIKSYEPSQKLYFQLIRYPQEIIPLLDHVLTDIFQERFEGALPEGMSLKVRPFNLPTVVNLRELNPSDIDQLVTIKGLMIRASPIIPDLKQAFFRCSACDFTVETENDRGRIAEPTVCPSNDCQSKNTMMLIHNRCLFSDKQICRLQETPDETPDGQTPYTVSLCSYDDLVDVAKPGDRVEITGIFRAISVRVNPRQRNIKSLFKTYIDVVHIKKSSKKRIAVDSSIVNQNEYHVEFDETDQIQTNVVEDEDELKSLSQRPDIYDFLSRSIAPSIYGLEDVKKGILLQLFGGSHKFAADKPGTPRIRGDLNILLVGDPGVSKSQLLQYVHKLAPRGVYTSGKGSSAVGLTAYVTRDPDTRQLVLESGALVLSDGGICCIDEFDKMSDFTRSVLHEVMEQQTISVAKAGIITTLNARTSILACANPINSKFDVNLSVPENVNLPPPLMSRFDLLYLILDKPNERDDRRLAQHLVSLYLTDQPIISAADYLPIEKFTQYLNYAKKIQPVISEEAGQCLVNFYVSMRKSGIVGGANVITFTTRQLESMIRLAEAHAKMRLSPTVERQDVEEANRLVLAALQAAAVDPRTGRIDLDLVTTGISSWGRTVHEHKRKAIRAVIHEFDKTTIRWTELYRTFNNQSDELLSENEFNSLLKDLMDEGFIHMNGRSNTERVIRKLKA
ncbi:MCM2/3/5 family-domain-containing protein [Globomyces pollinis-pini]|nr:MCM2/3/5 family-domain-containing protein [Globomyces pollinis-pini]